MILKMLQFLSICILYYSNNVYLHSFLILTLRTSEAGIPALRNFPVASEAGIPAWRKLPCSVGSRYTGTRMPESYRYRQDSSWKILFSMKYNEYLWTSFACEQLAANVRVRCRDFSKLRAYAVYSNRRPPSLFHKHCEILRPTLRMWKTLKRW